uniref:Uncharacterized protein n=1 Tax=Glossina palpalis gambiensis TaxID=67801 RepID=A0A1B0BRH8_9MUSC
MILYSGTGWQNSNCVNACINIFKGQWVKVEKDSVSSYTNGGVDIMYVTKMKCMYAFSFHIVNAHTLLFAYTFYLLLFCGKLIKHHFLIARTTDVFTRDVDMPLIGNRRTLNVLFRSLHVRGGKDDSQEPVGLPRCTRVVFWRRMPPPPLPTA